MQRGIEPDFADFCCVQDGLFVAPVEELTATGMSAPLRELLCARAGVDAAWCDLFDAALALYSERAAELARLAPRTWLPPRLQNVCIVTDARDGRPFRTRPFHEPFHRASWLVDVRDFDPGLSHREFAAYQFLHCERIGLLQEIAPALAHNLGYWLLRSESEREAFRAAGERTPRADAPAWRALAEALDWIPRLWHDPLKVLRIPPSEPCTTDPSTGLIVPRSLQRRFDQLLQAWRAGEEAAVAGHFAAHAAVVEGAAAAVVEWLARDRPPLLVTGPKERILWDPERPAEVAALRGALDRATASACASLQQELEIVADRSRRFLASLAAPEELPVPHPATEQEGVAWMHRERRLVALNLHEPRLERLRLPAPPLQRFLLGARTLHEWGHLAADAGWVGVPAEQRSDHEAAVSALAQAFEAAHANAPAPFRTLAAPSLAPLVARAGSIGKALADHLVHRLPDWQSNLLAQRFLTCAERETYVRSNVRSLLRDYPPAGLFQVLARHVYECQYLAFSRIGDARTHLLHTTWFEEQFLRRGILDEATLERLLAAAARVCGFQRVDETRFVALR